MEKGGRRGEPDHPRSFPLRRFLQRQRLYPFVAVLVPVGVILLLWRIIPSSFQKNENEDYFYFYLPVAQNIVHGDGITLRGKIACEYPPAYPIFIAAVLSTARLIHVDAETLLRASIALCLAISALLIYAIARLLWNPPGALMASLAWSTYPLILWAGKQHNSELPFMPFFYGAFLLFLHGWRSEKYRNWYFFCAGVMFGISMLVRPIAVGTGLLAALFALFCRKYPLRRRITVALLVIAGNAIAVGPWEAWMYKETGGFHMLCRSRQAVSMYDGLVFAIFNPEGFRKGVRVPQDVKEFMQRTIPKSYTANSTRKAMALVAGEFEAHPLVMVKLFAIKAARSWYGTNSNRLESIILVFQVFYLSLIAFACGIFWRFKPESRLPLAASLVLLLYFWAMTVSVLSIARYMVPMVGLMFIFLPVLNHNWGRIGELRHVPEKAGFC